MTKERLEQIRTLAANTRHKTGLELLAELDRLSSRVEELTAENATLTEANANLADDFESLQHDAAMVAKQWQYGDKDDLREALEEMENNGRPGWIAAALEGDGT
jgi:predicted nuclease with TOPRIM domain